jgi:hypothetical protein
MKLDRYGNLNLCVIKIDICLSNKAAYMQVYGSPKKWCDVVRFNFEVVRKI